MAISRDWVCVRLASYEDESEGAYLTELYRGRTGLLNNTTFALLAPDGETLLARSGRGPQFTIGNRPNPNQEAAPEDVQAFARKMEEVGANFAPKAEIAALPQSLDFRRALNIAACDNQPLVVVVTDGKNAREGAVKELAALAWKREFLGRLQYQVVRDRAQLAVVDGLPKGDFLAVIQPNDFGLEGRVIASAALDKDVDAAALLRQGLAAFAREGLSRRTHVERGRRANATWETVMPVTDEKKAREGGPPPPGD